MYPLVSEYINVRVRRGEFRGDTPRSARSILTNFLVGLDRPLQKAKRDHVQGWLDSLDCADSTKRNQLGYVKGFTRWLVDTGRLSSDPCEGVRAPKVSMSLPRGLSREVVEKLLASLPDVRAEAIVYLMLMNGLRAGGIASLQIGDLDRVTHNAIVREKGDKERLVPIHDEAWSALMRYLAAHPAGSGPVFRLYGKRSREGVNANWVSKNVGKWFTDAGVKAHAYDGRSGHALRHTFGTELADAGEEIRVIQELMGHESLVTTQLYCGRASRPALRAAVQSRSYR